MNIETLLSKEIGAEIEELEKLSVGSEQHKIGVDSLAKLLDKAIEIERLNIESEEKEKDRKINSEEKEKDRKEERKDRIVKNCLTASGIVLPILVTIWGTVKSLKFEETGTVTTIMGRGFVNKLLPKK